MKDQRTLGKILIHIICFSLGVGIGWVIEWKIDQLPAPEIAIGVGLLPFITGALGIAFGLGLIISRYVFRVATPTMSYWLCSVALGIAYPLLLHGLSLFNEILQEFVVLTWPFFSVVILHLIAHFREKSKNDSSIKTSII